MDSNLEQIKKAIESQRYKLICLNDGESISDFEKAKCDINKSFDKILGDKSSFEL